ncbi:hypothetical protein DFJ69_2636 [Thermomonospora umbrina]|uniref:Uncharacterized protein n=1 Tax=Thermomonospora umbrina TaxID=111806 RepID=A0A3D9SMU7_9ACTN|nr:hypothetical protein DFJ69_2636 [Thermomonospora umbrina]
MPFHRLDTRPWETPDPLWARTHPRPHPTPRTPGPSTD